jgi:hypothetical protein
MVISGRPAWPGRPNDNRPAPFRKIRSLGRVTASVRWRRCDGVGCDHLPLDAIVRTIEIDRLPAAGEAPRRRCGRRGSCCHERRDGPESSMCVWRYVNRLRSETVFLIVAGLFGLGCAVVTPPFQSPDEPTHLYRCYQLSEGTIVGVHRTATGGYAYGGDVPDSLKAACEPFRRLENHPEARVQIGTITGEFARPLRPGDRSFASFPNSALYSPVPYVPAVAGVWVGRQLRLPPVALMYLARLGTLAGFLPVGWLAVRVTPILKWPAVMLLCSPLVLFLAGSVSADPLTIGLAFLATALVLRQAVGPPVAGRGMAIAMVAVMVAVALCKSLYCPIAAMAVVARGRWLTGAIALGAAVGAAAMWSGVTHPMRVHQLGDDPARQMAWVTHHPVAFAATVGRSAREARHANVTAGHRGVPAGGRRPGRRLRRAGSVGPAAAPHRRPRHRRHGRPDRAGDVPRVGPHRRGADRRHSGPVFPAAVAAGVRRHPPAVARRRAAGVGDGGGGVWRVVHAVDGGSSVLRGLIDRLPRLSIIPFPSMIHTWPSTRRAHST